MAKTMFEKINKRHFGSMKIYDPEEIAMTVERLAPLHSFEFEGADHMTFEGDLKDFIHTRLQDSPPIHPRRTSKIFFCSRKSAAPDIFSNRNYFIWTPSLQDFFCDCMLNDFFLFSFWVAGIFFLKIFQPFPYKK